MITSPHTIKNGMNDSNDIIVFSTVAPALIAIDWRLSPYSLLRWLPIVTSAIVAILTSAMKTFKFQENWTRYRAACETLEREIHFYESYIGDYANIEEKSIICRASGKPNLSSNFF
jgi:hypothetical protein